MRSLQFLCTNSMKSGMIHTMAPLSSYQPHIKDSVDTLADDYHIAQQSLQKNLNQCNMWLYYSNPVYRTMKRCRYQATPVSWVSQKTQYMRMKEFNMSDNHDQKFNTNSITITKRSVLISAYEKGRVGRLLEI